MKAVNSNYPVLSAKKFGSFFFHRCRWLFVLLLLIGANGISTLTIYGQQTDTLEINKVNTESLIEVLMQRELFNLQSYRQSEAPQAIGVTNLTSQTATALAQSLVGTGVQISNVTFTGATRAAGTFTGGSNIIGFESGVVLSSGDISNIIGPNSSTSQSAGNGTAGDSSLNALVAPRTTNDAAVLQFTFVPTTNVISFQYVFGSEEYNEYANTEFNDVFAFFINGTNVALIPGTTTPVSINTVNGGNPLGTNPQNAQYFNNNPLNSPDTGLDGFTTVLNVQANVTPNQPNIIKLAIADTQDSSLDSAVMIKSNSIASLPATTTTVAPATGTAGGTTNLSATLKTVNNEPIANKTVTFKLNGNTVGTATTNTSGTATLNNVSLTGFTVGTYNTAVQAIFSGDTTYNASSGTGSLTVTANTCTYAINPISQNVSSAGGVFGFNVITAAGCAWNPVINSASTAWLSTTTGNSTGSGTVIYTVQANTGAARVGTITVQNQTFTVNQNAQTNPTYSISGRVNVGGVNLNGVTITLTGPVTRTTTTDFNGNYQIGDLAPANYIITPTLPGGVFNPVQTPVTISNANISGVNFGLGTCTYNLSQTATPVLPSGVSNGSFNVGSSGNCAWTAKSNVPWIVIADEGNGAGNGVVNYVVQHNYNAIRSGTISVNGQIFTVTQNGNFQAPGDNSKNAAPCDAVVTNGNPALDRIVVPFNGSSYSFQVNVTETNCKWTANDNSPWITVSSNGAEKTGNGTETFTVEPMTGGNTARKGTVTVLGREFTVIQTPKQLDGCTFSLNNALSSQPLDGGSGSFDVNVGPLCLWMANSVDDSWLKITGNPNGFGPGSKSFSVKPNQGTESRAGTVIIGDKAHMVNQAAAQAASCAYQLSSPGQTFAPAATSGSFTVTSGGGCAWSATKDANANWITISGGNGTGNGTVSFSLQANPNATARTGTITVNNRTYTVTQAGAQQACVYTISPGFQSIPNSGATGIIQLTANNGCSTAWTAVSNADWISITSGANGNSSASVNFVAQTNNTLVERIGTITVAGQTFTVTQAASATAIRTQFDFDGDTKADISVFRPSNGTWYFNQTTNGFTGAAFGTSTDRLTPADYDGDGKTDIAVFRDSVPGAGNFAYYYIMNSSTNTFTPVQFGATGDKPVAGDFDGDGKADLAVYRAGATANAQSFFFYRPSATPNVDFRTFYWGKAGDKPVVGDYDGDGKTDVAVYEPSNAGVWYILRSTNNQPQTVQFGAGTDVPVQADYDGDGKTDVAVFRPSNGAWYINRSAQGLTGITFGFGTDLPVPADYDGDGKADVAVFRNGTWFMNRSQAGFTGAAFGAATDKPLQNVYVP